MSNRFWTVVAVVAGLTAAAFLPRAFLIYFRAGPYRDAAGQVDAHRRWREAHYVLRGRNPYDVAAVHPNDEAVDNRPGPHGRNADVFPDLRTPEGVVYPPWAFPTQFAFFWPGAAGHLAYYGGWMAVGLAGVAVWAGSEVRRVPGGTIAGVAAALSVLACASWGGAVVVGNNPPVVVGLLVACHALLRRGWDVAGGLALGLALLKPTVAGPFVLPLLFTRRWRPLVAAGLLIAVESGITWALTGTDPVEMVRQMSVASRRFVGEGFGFTQYLVHAGLSPALAQPAVAAVVLVVGGAALFALRGRGLLVQFAVAAVVARLWAYHLYYDDAVLIFPLVYLAAEAQRTRSPAAVTGFLTLCLSLWLPGRLGQIRPVQAFHLLVWTGVAVVASLIAGGSATARIFGVPIVTPDPTGE